MKVRFNRVPLYLTLALVPLAMVGCGESKDKDLGANPSPQPIASAPFPSPSVPPTLNSPGLQTPMIACESSRVDDPTPLVPLGQWQVWPLQMVVLRRAEIVLVPNSL
jgi:hypothetical protein